jgi:hypothetical protein
MPDPSYASPALEVAPEDKSGAALAWFLSPFLSIVVASRWPGAGTGHRIEDTMSHDKIKAAARRRMAETGEPYATARREVIKEHKAARGRRDPGAATQRFALSYDTPRADTLLGIGPGSSGVEVDADQIRIRMGWAFKLDIPRSSVRSATRSRARLRGTRGVHGRAGRFVVNGSADGLVELTIEPPCFLERRLSTLFRREKVSSLTMSLADPDAFLAAVAQP